MKQTKKPTESQLLCKTSNEVWNRGENIQHRDKIITTSSAGEVGRGENVSECVQTVHCPGNCASRPYHHSRSGKGGIMLDNNISGPKNINIGSNILPKSVKSVEHKSVEHKQSSNIFSQETLSENIHSYEGNLLPNYVTWLEDLIGAKQTVGSGGCLQDGVEGGEHGQDQLLEGVARA